MAEIWGSVDIVYHDGGDRMRVVCSFKSHVRNEGTMVQATETRGGDFRISTPPTQPDLNLYPEREANYMKLATALVWRMCGGKI